MSFPAGAYVTWRPTGARSDEVAVLRLGASADAPATLLESAPLTMGMPISVFERAGSTAFWARYFARLAGHAPASLGGLAAMLDVTPTAGTWALRSAPDAPARMAGGWAMPWMTPSLAETRASVSRDWLGVTVQREHNDPTRHWLAVRVAGALIARRAGIATLELKPDPAIEAFEVRRIDARFDKRVMHFDPIVDGALLDANCTAVHDVRGGPSAASLFEALHSTSDRPAHDVATLVRYMILGVLLGDVTVHAGYVCIARQTSPGGQARWGLVPPPPPVLAPETVGAPEMPGWRIGASRPDDHLRTDHWMGLAQAAQVRPRLVLTTLQEFASQAPAWTAEALREAYAGLRLHAAQHRGVPRLALDLVQRRCARAADLLFTAEREGVAGMRALLRERERRANSTQTPGPETRPPPSRASFVRDDIG